MNTSISIEDTNTHKLIYVVTDSRSCSTALLRYFVARGDVTAINELSQKAFAQQSNFSEETKDWFSEEAAQNFEEVKNRLVVSLKTKSLMVKEEGFAVDSFIANHIDDLNKLNVHFVFLYRRVHDSVISFWKASQNTIFPGFSHILGYSSLLKIMKFVKQKALHPVISVRSEDLYNDPENTLKRLCFKLEIPFKKEDLNWESFEDTFTGNEWSESKVLPKAIHWHERAIRSRGFERPTIYALDVNGLPTFDEIDEGQKEICKQIWVENLEVFNEIDALFEA